jgi:hypothetical protein
VRGYEGLHLPLTRCIHFVTRKPMRVTEAGIPIPGSLDEIVEAAIGKGVKFIYWDYLDSGGTSTTIADPLGKALQLQHAPYGRLPWIPFLDDLITLAHRYRGLVIVVDHADSLLRERPDDMFDLIEAFLTQFHHWYDQKKPCHLCFQIERNDSVRRVFARGADGPIQAAMPRRPEQPRPPNLWEIYGSIGEFEERHVGTFLGTIEAASENEAIEKASAKWKGKLLAVPARRRP